MKARRIAGVLIALVLVVGVIAAGFPPGAHAQDDDWSARYRPALLPAFVGDMASYADAPRYTLDLTLDDTLAGATITGAQQVIYTNRAAIALASIVFRLYPNLESYGGDMTVTGLTVDGVPITPTLDATRSILTVPLTVPLLPGAAVTLNMQFAIIVTADRAPLYAQFSELDGVLALPNAYPVLSVYETGQGWWQVTDHPQGDAVFSETAFYDVTVTAPAALVLAASGSEIGLVANADSTLTHHYVAPLMRDFALFASTQYVALSGEQNGVTVTMYYDSTRPDARVAARAGLELAREAVRIYDSAFGPYPFSELDVVQTPTTAGGIEYPGVFVVATNVWNKDDEFFQFVIAHEAAHQWWYSLVGSDQTLDPWMDESLAQYSVAVFIRDREGADAYRAALDSFRTQYEQYVALYPDQTIGQPVSSYSGGAYFYMVYEKGPLFYAALEDLVGYDAVIAMLRDYFMAYRYRIATPDAMRASYQASLGLDLSALFTEWVGDVPVG